MKISVLGSGAFGTALAISLSTGDNSITLWGRNPKQVIAFSQDRENKERLPNCPFPTSLCVTSNLELACDADAILIAVPTQSLHKFVEENNLNSYIRFLPFTKNPFKYIISSDVKVLSSRFEGNPNILLEVACLKKIIVSVLFKG